MHIIFLCCRKWSALSCISLFIEAFSVSRYVNCGCLCYHVSTQQSMCVKFLCVWILMCLSYIFYYSWILMCLSYILCVCVCVRALHSFSYFSVSLTLSTLCICLSCKHDVVCCVIISFFFFVLVLDSCQCG